jgi:hypothetical protein
MATAPAVESPAECPPHHWLITEEPGARQQWTCLRCSAARTVDLHLPIDRPADQPAKWGAVRR